MSELTMTIDGAAVAGAGHFSVRNPATAEIFAQAPECTPEQLDAAMAAAARVYPAWSLDEKARRHALRAAADTLESEVEPLARLITTEQGKPLAQAREEVTAATAWLRHYADMELPHEIVQNDDQGYAEVAARPLGVVAAIAPWNFPIVLAVWKVAPALLAGNTMVLKPSPPTGTGLSCRYRQAPRTCVDVVAGQAWAGLTG
ncbi:aldehyde dehydrogenase family protein [Streptomyces sp. NPDC060035]|uniref:aldehyde dehydrogenase family protein n=1 Tax=Streptomyces sp. NPDC060035 TaxID=3347044 RepID=UPI00369CE6B5